MGWRRPLLPGESPLSLAISGNGRYLENQGTPFPAFWESAWDIANMLPLTGTHSVETYLESRRAIGVNGVLMRLLTKRSDQTGSDGTATLGIGLRDNTLPFATPGDLSTPNEDYFAHYDEVISMANIRGIAVILAICYLGYSGGGQQNADGWGPQLAAMTPAEAEDYAAFLAARWTGFDNLIVLIGGDHTATGTQLTRCQNLIDGYTSVDPDKLFVYHGDNGTRSDDIGLDFSATGGLLDGCYSWTAGTLDGLLVAARADAPARPVFQIESPYENNPGAGGDRYRVRCDYAVSCILGMGGIVGDEEVWPGGADDPPVVTGVDTDAEWLTSLDDTARGIRDCGRLRTMLSTRAWHQLDPTTSLTSSGYGARNAAGTFGLAFSRDGSSYDVAMSQFSGPVTARWFDATNGTLTLATGTQPFANSGTRAFNPAAFGSNSAGDADLVLVLEVL